VCEVASQLLAHPDVVIILVGDMSVVAASAEIKYAPLEVPSLSVATAADGPAVSLPGYAYGRRYLEKLVQVQFDLPPQDASSLRDVLTATSAAPVPPVQQSPPTPPDTEQPSSRVSHDQGRQLASGGTRSGWLKNERSTAKIVRNWLIGNVALVVLVAIINPVNSPRGLGWYGAPEIEKCS
jgi:hypothetical protein